MTVKYTDCAIISVPPILLLGPHLAPAILKASGQQHGFKINCYNPSIDLFESLSSTERDNWPYNDFNKIFKNKTSLLKLIDSLVMKISIEKPRYIGLSTHAWSSTYFIKLFSDSIRANIRDTKIIIGGPIIMEIGKELLRDNIVDYYVVGDGEDAFISILNDDFSHPNINGSKPTPIDNEKFNNLPEPDFSDSDVAYFKKNSPNGNRIYLIGSRGCIFNCSFCNVPSITSKFRIKARKKFAQEIIMVQKKYKTEYIELADSILNNSANDFRELSKEIINLRKHNDIDLRLICFYRLRKRKYMSEIDFKLASEAGFKRFKIGFESGSYDVRKHIGKTEDNDDLFFCLEMCLKYNIKVNLLLIVGYVNETRELFEQTLDVLKKIRSLDLDLAIEMVVVNELYISNFTRLHKMADDLNINIYPDEDRDKYNWDRLLPDGQVLNKKVRMDRIIEVNSYVKTHFRGTRNLLTFSHFEKKSDYILGSSSKENNDPS